MGRRTWEWAELGRLEKVDSHRTGGTQPGHMASLSISPFSMIRTATGRRPSHDVHHHGRSQAPRQCVVLLWVLVASGHWPGPAEAGQTQQKGTKGVQDGSQPCHTPFLGRASSKGDDARKGGCEMINRRSGGEAQEKRRRRAGEGQGSTGEARAEEGGADVLTHPCKYAVIAVIHRRLCRWPLALTGCHHWHGCCLASGPGLLSRVPAQKI